VIVTRRTALRAKALTNARFVALCFGMTENAASAETSDGSRVRRKLKVLLIRGLAVVGAICVGTAALIGLVKLTKPFWWSDRPNATLLSTNGRFKAIVYLSDGGGPATSYCGVTIYVGPSGASETDIRVNQNRIYAGACGGLCEGHWEQNLKWKSPGELDIDFDASAAAADGEATIRGYAVGGKVRINYHALNLGGCSF
jgi:hypothetical protein